MIKSLVTNGCSYINFYASGGGHNDLAAHLGIANAHTLAKSGSCNNRIIRTTLRDSYSTNESTLYIIGITFITRYELPLIAGNAELDGKWKSFTTTAATVDSTLVLDKHVQLQDIKLYSELWQKFTTLAVNDLAQNLQYQLLSMCDSLINRGHRCVIFNTAESMLDYVPYNALDLLRSRSEIINGLAWKSIPWQFSQGATWTKEDNGLPVEVRHVAPGQHKWLNQYLTNYIQEHKILA